MNDTLGLLKMKGETLTLAPHRFDQMQAKYYLAWVLLKKQILGYAVINGWYWLIVRDSEGVYVKVPFARNEVWFRALTSDPEFMSIAQLPQIYITGVA